MDENFPLLVEAIKNSLLKIGKFVNVIEGLAENPEYDPEVFSNDLEKILDHLLGVEDIIKFYEHGGMEEYKGQEFEPEDLETIASLATEFDKTGDPALMKQAAVLDEILLTIGAQKNKVSELKKAQDQEVAKLKALIINAEKEKNDLYSFVRTYQDKQNGGEEARAALGKVKEWRSLENPLQSRSCPDHAGALMVRIAENTFQCSLDKKIYNYEVGYTKMDGSKINGGSVSNQTQSLLDRPNEITSFDTRESRLRNR